MPKREVTYEVKFWRVAVEMVIKGPLHATSPQNPQGVGYMMDRMPSEAVLEARKAAGETITPVDKLTEEVLEQVGATGPEAEELPQMAVFRRDEKGVFLHDNFILGHIRGCGDALSRSLNFWGLQTFINKTLSVRPERIYLEGEVKVERWPTHFDIYRKGRVSSFREAEFVESPTLHFNIFLLQDPRWKASLLKALFDYGAGHGIGGGRARGMGRYSYTLTGWEKATPEEVWGDAVRPGVD